MTDSTGKPRSGSTRWLRIETISDVAETQLCCGCGVCASAQSDVITMVDDLDAGRRPLVTEGADTAEALSICPGIGLTRGDRPDDVSKELWNDWGPILGLWEGHAADAEIRFSGSSGGAASALALHAIEALDFVGILHTAERSDNPILNETVMSTTREQVLSRTGSRYSPASPADGLALIENSAGSSVFIGKPCDVAGALSLSRTRPVLERNLGLTIAVFCAGTPSSRGTLEMLRVMGVEPNQIDTLRYRGNGWPGQATATFTDEANVTTERSLSYGESWGAILQQHRQWRCHLCFDHTGEFADISVGDPWHREVGPNEIGSSLVIARTERGRAVIESAMGAGTLNLEPVGTQILISSQPNLLITRGSVWARIRTLKIIGLPAPRHRGVNLRRLWLRKLSIQQRARSIIGTIRRVKRRSLDVRHPVNPHPPDEPENTDSKGQG